MVEWSTNDAASVHQAQGVVRCSRFLRSARVSKRTTSTGLEWVAKIYAKTDTDAFINRGLEQKTITVGEQHFDTLRRAKAWAETWLQH